VMVVAWCTLVYYVYNRRPMTLFGMLRYTTRFLPHKIKSPQVPFGPPVPHTFDTVNGIGLGGDSNTEIANCSL
jgi:hypothetical protein